ncbi:class I SAM-dependent methyltransferase [Testudinibacter sp. TR-2022]|uniref:class I SAM-dependent methyltransferase n=1 Tax=Testudinibacter sp. TR-2022 TaxID=2585029 RepID=UPI00111B3FFD|nr:class I SAM-dependent methyltransferase [Testudinibacter sp. TR-2022]TNH09274.1 class I SAM-dependent methyltransferase [Pasteurellaceae bacterium Phil11]TNH25785.1 class I SAM-dependent methyltransferase [Testudinibacter sp. TR-2022]TNH28589.1 class I SAM-dependent methyltransferase [Testudinibacter sp. TR-2022]
MKKEEVGHNFLARLGKTRLRPGGRRATEWLIGHGNFNSDSQVLEVACNMATTAIGLAKQYGCQITAVDLDEQALSKAEANIQRHGLQDNIHLQRANATKLPFDDNCFDVVINEAMLTMLPLEAKRKAVSEYFRVLKPGGVLLTHDVMLTRDDDPEIIQALRHAINITVTPLSQANWQNLFLECGFSRCESIYDRMTLLSPIGMIYDEGVAGTFNIVRNALKPQNFPTFKKMFKLFNDPQQRLNFIAVCSYKAE